MKLEQSVLKGHTEVINFKANKKYNPNYAADFYMDTEMYHLPFSSPSWSIVPGLSLKASSPAERVKITRPAQFQAQTSQTHGNDGCWLLFWLPLVSEDCLLTFSLRTMAFFWLTSSTNTASRAPTNRLPPSSLSSSFVVLLTSWLLKKVRCLPGLPVKHVHPGLHMFKGNQHLVRET